MYNALADNEALSAADKLFLQQSESSPGIRDSHIASVRFFEQISAGYRVKAESFIEYAMLNANGFVAQIAALSPTEPDTVELQSELKQKLKDIFKAYQTDGALELDYTTECRYALPE